MINKDRSAVFWKNIVRDSSALSPIDRISEVLFGLIMVLTFTGAISASADGRDEVGKLLWAALGCNVAWGIVDGIMYLMNVLVERGHARKMLLKLKHSKDESADQIIREEFPPVVGHLLNAEEISRIRIELKDIPLPPRNGLLSTGDFVAAIQIFFIVFVSTLPVALPFVFMKDMLLALRVSNGITLVLLFIGGFRLAHYGGFRPWLTGLIYTLIGVILVSITMSLGG
ncbi:MAG: VIT1/CCC1 transporter family protein [Bacteroidetes bacterium]|nr:VIT1/CCC1 transporter family protein [Bacteroidota bacterium]